MPSPDEKPVQPSLFLPKSSQLSEELIRKTMEALQEGRLQWPSADEIAQQMARNRQRLPGDRQLERMAAEGHTNFIDPQTQRQIQQWCQDDERVDQFWTILTTRVRRGLNEEIVHGILDGLGRVLTMNDRVISRMRKNQAENHAWIREAAEKVIAAYDDAARRGDVVYMEEAVTELDAALDDLRGTDGQK